jgi:hypothetical protein
MHRRPNGGSNNGRRPPNGGGRRGGEVNLGSALAARDKYMEKAKEALSEGDRVSAENFFQHADHYNRIVIENEERRQFEDFSKPVDIAILAGELENNREPVIDETAYPQANTVAMPGDIAPEAAVL